MTSQDSVSRSVLVQVEHLLGSGRFENVQILHHELVFFGPANAKASLALKTVASLADALHDLRIEQVKDFLVVDLQEADKDVVVARRLGLLHLFDARKKLFDAALRNADVFVVVARAR